MWTWSYLREQFLEEKMPHLGKAWGAAIQEDPRAPSLQFDREVARFEGRTRGAEFGKQNSSEAASRVSSHSSDESDQGDAELGLLGASDEGRI